MAQVPEPLRAKAIRCRPQRSNRSVLRSTWGFRAADCDEASSAAGFGQRKAPGMPGTGLRLLSRFTSKLRCLAFSGVARTLPDSE